MMMRYKTSSHKILTSLFFTLLFFNGCSAGKKVVVHEPKPLPSWYTNPPNSSERFLYEVAEGVDKQDAITKALNLMASTLSVTIASEYKSHTTARSGSINSYQQDVESAIQADVKPIRISSYQLLESTEQGFRRHLVLIKSDKQQLFESLKKELDENIALLEGQKNSIKNGNVIEQLRFYKQADNDFASVRHTLNVMHVLNNRFDSAPYIQAAERYKGGYNDLRSKVTFGFKANRDALNLVEPIKAGLSAEKLLVQDKYDRYHLTVFIAAKIDRVQSMGFDLARTAISVTTQDHLGTTIGSNKLNITGQSTQGYAVAEENVAIKLKRLIDKEGIENILGLAF
ncbi:LPP20 family lipoprotein [Sulfurimonas sp. HSL3-7]|uniref:LPP20 family lipoprotein n=1 Tax=Sulfonitrofixus jiaomeiensis TaxID=3131938 RepID=UPI0031F74981